MKKLLSIIICITMLASLAVPAFAAEDEIDPGFTVGSLEDIGLDLGGLGGGSYKVTVNGGSAYVLLGQLGPNITANAGDTVYLLPGVAPSGMQFSGWKVQPNSLFDLFLQLDSLLFIYSFTMPARDVVIDAVYGEATIGGGLIEMYNYKINNGTLSIADWLPGTSTGSMLPGLEVVISANAAPEGCTFDHWEIVDGLGVDMILDLFTTPMTIKMPNHRLELTAVYRAKSNTIVYDANGGVGAPAPESFSLLQQMTISTTVPTRSGYKFLGWADKPDAAQPMWQPGDVYNKPLGGVVYAVWEMYTDTLLMSDFVERLYNVCLGREAAQEELDYYIWLLKDCGETGINVAAKFVFSDEFKMKNYCDRHYATALYNAFMGREPAEKEVDNWAWHLQQGDTREAVFNEFALSSEFAAICAKAKIVPGEAIAAAAPGTRQGGYCTVPNCDAHEKICEFVEMLYSKSLDRTPTHSEIDAWHYYLVHGDYTGTTAAEYFFFSEEFTDRGLSDEEYISHLYAAMLGRKPSEDDISYWTWLLSDPQMTRADVFERFANEDEFAVICQSHGVIL